MEKSQNCPSAQFCPMLIVGISIALVVVQIDLIWYLIKEDAIKSKSRYVCNLNILFRKII